MSLPQQPESIGEVQNASEWVPGHTAERTGLSAAIHALAVDEGFEVSNTTHRRAFNVASHEGMNTGKTFHTSKIGEGKYRVWRSA